MTERETRNEELKARIRRDAEEHCKFIDTLEAELKQREVIVKGLAEEVDRLRSNETRAA